VRVVNFCRAAVVEVDTPLQTPLLSLLALSSTDPAPLFSQLELGLKDCVFIQPNYAIPLAKLQLPGFSALTSKAYVCSWRFVCKGFFS
jgi:hypothetical protein